MTGGIHGQRWMKVKGGRKVRESVEHRLSKVQSSGHEAGHYMGFWGYGGGNRLPWDRSFSSFLSSLFFPSLSLSLFLLSFPLSFTRLLHTLLFGLLFLSFSLSLFLSLPTPGLSNRRQNLYLAAATEMHPRLNGGRAFNGAANCETKNIWFPKEQP